MSGHFHTFICKTNNCLQELKIPGKPNHSLMNRLNQNDPLFKNLENNPPDWWQTLVNDKDIYIEIRKDNYIDVYYNGGNIIRRLMHKGKEYAGAIHYKYLLPDDEDYVDYKFSSDGKTMVKKTTIELLKTANFDKETLKRIKANISRYYPATSEKGVQARFILQKDSRFIDSEFAYNKTDDKMRIDLVWLDLKQKKIVPVELKIMGDPRLYTNEIVVQLQTYANFFENNQVELLKYYQKVFEIKKRLNILREGLKQLNSLADFTIHTKPLLVIGGCEQAWIDKNKDLINAKVSPIAYGTYYYGSVGSCDLEQREHKNRCVFDQGNNFILK